MQIYQELAKDSSGNLTTSVLRRLQAAGRGPKERSEINRLYDLTSHLNVDDTKAAQGRQVLRGWKFFITSQTVPTTPWQS